MSLVTLEWFKKQAQIMVKKHWRIDYIPEIVIDSDRERDWSNTLAVYWNDTKTIEFKSAINERLPLSRLKKILLHELCHWYLHINDQPFRDGDKRFATELIRVGAGSTHNHDEKALTAYTEAKKHKKIETFEIIERNSDQIIVSRLRHHRKNQDDFKKDLAETLIRMESEREEDESIYPADVADKMVEWHGYKTDPIATCAIEISQGDGYGTGDIGDKEDVAHVLSKLGMDWEEIENRLKIDNE